MKELTENEKEYITNVVIFDLDGTLALIDHRRHFVTGKKKNWDAFHKACIHDEVNKPIADIFRLLASSGRHLIVFSGRSDTALSETYSWLGFNNLIPFGMYMRKEGDFAPDHVLKEVWLKDLQAAGITVDCVFDDRKSVVDMWRNNGITCLQVAPGDF